MPKISLRNIGSVSFPKNTTDPTDGAAGDMQYRTDLNKFRIYDTTWKNIIIEDSGAFIQNQNASAQTASFWITSSGQTAKISTSSTTNNPLYIQNISSAGYSSIAVLSNTGTFVGGFGYGNTGTAVFNDKFYYSTSGKNIVFSVDNNTAHATLSTSGNLSIGIATDVGSRIYSVSDGNPAFYGINLGAGNVINIQSNSASGYSAIGLNDNTGTPIGSLGYANASAPSAIPNSIFISGINKKIVLSVDGGTTAHATLTTNGNFLIGTTTDAGYRLAVTSTGAGVCGNFTGANTTGGGVLEVRNSATAGRSAVAFINSGSSSVGQVGYGNSTSGGALQGSVYLVSSGVQVVLGTNDSTAVALVLDTLNNTIVKAGFVSDAKQVHIAGATVTMNDNIRALYINPAALLSPLTITMPAGPRDGQEVLISFGGTITSGAVATELSIVGNTGHTVLKGSTITSAQAGDGYILKFESSTNLWRIF